MRIVHVVEPFSSGIITFIINLTIALPEHEHLVIHGTRTTEDEMNAVRSRFPKYVSFKVWKYAGRELDASSDYKSGQELYRMLKKMSFDVLHLHSAKAGTIGKIVAARLKRGASAIYTPNGAPFLRTDISAGKKSLFRTVEYLSNRWIGHLIACGPSEALAYEGIGIKNTYINNGVPVLPSKRREVQIPVKVGCSGILTAQKDPSTFFNIANHFVDDDRVEFVWIGDGEMRKSLDDRGVRITGWMDKSAAIKEIQHIDIYLSAALWEGLPFAVLESMSNNSCLLLRDCPGNRDLVREDYNGFLFETMEEGISLLQRLVDEPELINRFGNNSRILCEEEYSIDQMGSKYDAVYKELGK